MWVGVSVWVGEECVCVCVRSGDVRVCVGVGGVWCVRGGIKGV